MPVEAKFRRVLSRRDLILYGLVILTPPAPYPLYGIVQQVSHGHAALSYLVAMIGMLFTGNSCENVRCISVRGLDIHVCATCLERACRISRGLGDDSRLFSNPLTKRHLCCAHCSENAALGSISRMGSVVHHRNHSNKCARNSGHCQSQYSHDVYHERLRAPIHLPRGTFRSGPARPGRSPLPSRTYSAANFRLALPHTGRGYRYSFVHRFRRDLDTCGRHCSPRTRHRIRDSSGMSAANRNLRHHRLSRCLGNAGVR
mgnify:CR=1 FL=1